jgi:hypothetical protein
MVTENSKVHYRGDFDTLFYDFNFAENISNIVLLNPGVVTKIVNGGTHAIVAYNTPFTDGTPSASLWPEVPLPISSLELIIDHDFAVKANKELDDSWFANRE